MGRSPAPFALRNAVDPYVGRMVDNSVARVPYSRVPEGEVAQQIAAMARANLAGAPERDRGPRGERDQAYWDARGERLRGGYSLLENPFDEEGRARLAHTLWNVPMGGYIQNPLTQMGMGPREARWAERGVAATTVGVGAAGFLAAVQALNDNTQTPGTIPIQ